MGLPMRFCRRLIDEGFSGGRLEVADEVIDPAMVEHQDYGPGHASGAEGVKAVIASLRRAFPDFRLEIEDIAVAGDVAWSRNVATGTNDGSFMGHPPTGRHDADRRDRRRPRARRQDHRALGRARPARRPAAAGARGLADLQVVVEAVSTSRPSSVIEDQVLQAHAAEVLAVDAGLVGDHVAGLEAGAAADSHVRRLVDVEADAVAEAVEEVLVQRLAPARDRASSESRPPRSRRRPPPTAGAPERPVRSPRCCAGATPAPRSCMCRSRSGASPKQNVRVMSAQNRLAQSLGKTSMMIGSCGPDRAAAQVVDARAAGPGTDDRRLALAAVVTQHRDDLVAHPLAGQRLAVQHQVAAAAGRGPSRSAHGRRRTPPQSRAGPAVCRRVWPGVLRRRRASNSSRSGVTVTACSRR